MEFWQNIVLKWKQIQQFCLWALSSDPSGLIESGLYYNTTANRAALRDDTKTQFLAHLEDTYKNAGVVKQPTITKGAGSVTVGNDAIIRCYKTTDYSGIIQEVVNPTGGTFALTENTPLWLVYTYGVGYSVQTSITGPLSNAIPIYRFFNAFGVIHSSTQDEMGVGATEKILVKQARTEYIKRVGDSGIELSTSALNVLISGGLAYNGPILENILPFNSATHNLYRIVYDDGVWSQTLLHALTNTHYNPSTGLATLNSNKYCWAYVWRSIGDDVEALFQLGEQEYATEALAIADLGKMPSNIYGLYATHCVLVGYVLIKQGVTTTQYFSAWGQPAVAGAPVYHNTLAGLDGGDPATAYMGHAKLIDNSRMDAAGAANGYALYDANGNLPDYVQLKSVLGTGQTSKLTASALNSSVAQGWTKLYSWTPAAYTKRHMMLHVSSGARGLVTAVVYVSFMQEALTNTLAAGSVLVQCVRDCDTNNALALIYNSTSAMVELWINDNGVGNQQCVFTPIKITGPLPTAYYGVSQATLPTYSIKFDGVECRVDYLIGLTGNVQTQLDGKSPLNTTLVANAGSATPPTTTLGTLASKIQALRDNVVYILANWLQLGETSATAYRGDRGKTAYDHSQLTASNPHGTTAAQINGTLSDNAGSTTLPVAGTATAINTLLQSVRDNLKSVFASISNLTGDYVSKSASTIQSVASSLNISSAHVGAWVSNTLHARVGHVNFNLPSGFGFLQTNDGRVILEVPADKSIALRIDGVQKASLGVNGLWYVTVPEAGATDNAAVSASWVRGYAQPLDTTLTALAGLDASAGMVVQIAADSFVKRSVVDGIGTTITNGNGVSGNLSVNVVYETSTANVKMNGPVAVGTLNTAARGDHVHPVDTSRAPANATLTNEPGQDVLPTGTYSVGTLLQWFRNNLSQLFTSVTSISGDYVSKTTTSVQYLLSTIWSTNGGFISERATGNTAFGARVTGNAVLKILATVDGVFKWSDGTNAADTELSRTAANELTTPDNFKALSLDKSGGTDNTALTGNVQTLLNGKAPTSHASTDTTYGVGSATNYGHAMASSATPLMAGTASAGTDNGKYTREGHVHPSDNTKMTAPKNYIGELSASQTITPTDGDVYLINGSGLTITLSNSSAVLSNAYLIYSTACGASQHTIQFYDYFGNLKVLKTRPYTGSVENSTILARKGLNGWMVIGY